MKTIDEDIKNRQFKSCYLFYGEEAYLKKQYKDKLLGAMAKAGDTMNVSVFEGKGIRPGELIDLAETLPFFADRRVIVVEESGFFKHPCEPLTEYLPQIPATTSFLFVESEVDKRAKAYKAAKKSGSVIEFSTQSESLITRWILGRIGKEGKKITQPVLTLFLSRTGLDMGNIDRELEKLLCYTLQKEIIEADDIRAIVTEQIENKIFEMIDAISGHNQEKALHLYYGLLALKEAPMRILFLIIRQFRILLEVKELTQQGYGGQEIAQKIKAPAFAIRKYQTQARRFTIKQLLLALRDGACAEEAVKTGHMQDKIAVELLIVQYSKGGDLCVF